jgi:hypothetical protein
MFALFNEGASAMRKSVAGALLLFAFTGSAYAKVCFDDTITQVHTGEVNHALGNDGGNAILFHTGDARLWKIDDRYNMNDPQGIFMFKALGLAKAGGYKLVGLDNWNGLCDKINQLTLSAG